MAKSPTSKKPLLADHKKIGKKLVPPMIQIGSLRLTSWMDTGLPECVWLAALHREIGMPEGVKLAVDLCQAAVAVKPATYIVVSDFESLSADDWQNIRAKLDASQRDKFCDGLRRLFRIYPECPLVRFCEPPSEEPSKSDIEWIKELLSALFNKSSRPATLALSTLVYVQMAQGRLVIGQGSLLSKLPEVERYPDTPESRRVASSVRATVNTFAGRSEKPLWPRYFWARNFALDDCYFDEIDHESG